MPDNPNADRIDTRELVVDPEQLWQAADRLRGAVDAAEYKHVVLGLIFLKYISDAFLARRDAIAVELAADGIEGEQAEGLLESRDALLPKLISGELAVPARNGGGDG